MSPARKRASRPDRKAAGARTRESNRSRMGVAPDHKTRSMKKGRRGTYP